MNKQILVPLDGTMVAHMALPHAVALARATSSRLILLYVTPPASDSRALGLSRAARATAMHGHHRDNGDHRDGLALQHRYLEATAEDIQDEGLPVQTEILEGDPATVISSRAENDPTIWTIVMATRGMGTDRSFNRSVTEKVLRTSVPILLVHPDEKMDSLRRFYRRTYQTILVPLDGSALAEQALAPASTLAGAMGASLLLLSVIPVPHVGDVGHAMHIVHTMDTVSAAEETGDLSYKGSEAGDGDRFGQGERRRSYLSKTAEALRSSGLAVRAEIAYGAAAEEVLRFAADARAGLIVMSTCCRSELRCLLGGSMVRKVTQEAKLPVLLVRTQMAACQEQRRQGRPGEHRNEEVAVMSSTKGVVAQQVPARL